MNKDMRLSIKAERFFEEGLPEIEIAIHELFTCIDELREEIIKLKEGRA